MNKIVPIILFFVFAFIAQVFSSPTDTTVVYCDSVVLGNDTFYNDTVVSVPGEDAKEIMMHIIINHKVTLSISDTVCNSYTWNDSTYTSSGVYTQTFTASNGCDSIVTLNLTVIPPPDPPTVTDTSRCGAGALTLDVAITDPNWIVQWFADSTTVDVLATGLQYSTGSLAVSETPYLYYVQSVNDHYQNCNSKRVAITAMVNAIPERPMVTEYTNCGPGSFQLTPDNTNSCHWYLAPTATSYTETTPFATGYISESTSFFVSNVDSTNGCESGKVEFPVIIYPIPDTVDIYDVACKGNPYTEYGLDIVFSSEGEKHFVLPLLESFHGCDSVRILHVNVLLPQQYSFEDTACDIYTWNDSTYTSSGVYTQTFTASNGCDSIVTLNLTVKQSTSAIEPLTLCSTQLPYSYNDTLLITTEGNYIFTIPNEAGCDSVVTLAVTVIPSPSEPAVSSVTRCGPGSVTLQASAGQNGTTCYWYSTEDTAETIHTGANFQSILSETTVFYVASVNESTGCVSTRVADTAIVFTVPSSPNVADAARCGAGPVTMDVTVADMGWTVQWFANDTTAEVLAAGVQYTTDTLPVSTSPYVYYVQSADEHCPSHRVMVSVMVNPVPSEPTVSNATSCGPDTVTLQAIVGQNGTTCYWYSSEETSETIHTGTSYRFFLSDTMVLYVASVNEATGCVSTRVSDTAIVYNVPSSPNVADASRCGAGPVTMDVTVADTGWTVQWFANDTTAEVLATGVQYTTDTLPVSTAPYMYYVQSADEHCQSSREMIIVTVNAIPEMYAIIGDTSVCRNQYVEYRYPVDDSENYRYVWYFFSDPDQDSTLEYNIPVWERYIEDSVSQVITVGMYVQDLQTNCMNDTSLTIHVSEEFSPDRTQIVRKNNSNILIYNNSSSLPSDIHYRWGYTDKLTFEETVVQDWIYNYYQYSFIDTIQFRYWVEAYVFYEDDTCRNRTYYLDEVVTIQDYFEDFDVIAFISGNQLQIQVDNPSGQHTVAVLYDMAGRTIAQWDLGIDSVIRKQISFGYPNGIYLLTVQVGNRRHTTKILNQQ